MIKLIKTKPLRCENLKIYVLPKSFSSVPNCVQGTGVNTQLTQKLICSSGMSSNKKKVKKPQTFRPTDPRFFWHVTGN